MPVTFPRSLPTWLKSMESNFSPVFGVVSPRSRSGEVLSVEYADAYWSASLTSVAIDQHDVLRLRRWFDSMRGGLYSFLAHDSARELPYNYRTGFDGLTIAGGATPFVGALTVDSLTSGSVTVSQLPADFVFTEGDYIGLVENGRYGLHAILEDVTGSAGGVATVEVHPPIKTTIFTSSAVGNLDKPLGEFKPVSFEGQPSINRTSVRITGVQVI